MGKLKVFAFGVGLILLSLFAYVGLAQAQTVKSGDTASLAAGQKVDSMLFAAGNTVDIAGEVNGDVYCAGQTVSISGTVHGDVFCGGQTVTVSGHIEGSARLAGQNVTISGKVEDNATIGAQSFTLTHDGAVRQDILGGTQTSNINGTVGRDIAAGADSLEINSKVGRNVKGNIGTIKVGSDGQIAGNVEYASANEPVVSSGGKINGKVIRTQPKEDDKPRYALLDFSFVFFIYIFIAALLVALAIALLFPSLIHNAASKAIASPGKTALVGIVTVFAAPVMIVALFVSVIGIPLGLLTLLMWLVVIIFSGPLSGYMLGRLLFKDSKRPVVITLAGASLLIVLYFIPVFGWIAMLVAYVFGVGMFIREAMRRLPKPQYQVK